jgi:hypothetical protein
VSAADRNRVTELFYYQQLVYTLIGCNQLKCIIVVGNKTILLQPQHGMKNIQFQEQSNLVDESGMIRTQMGSTVD